MLQNLCCSMKMEIEIPNGYKAKWVNGVLALVPDEEEDLRPVTERVKTFLDAVAELGEDHSLCVQSREIYDNFLFEGGDAVVDIVAYLKLRIITAALNEGWIPEQFNKELRYYPRFELYNENGWETLTEDIKRERGLLLSGDEIHGVVVNSVCDYMRFCPRVRLRTQALTFALKAENLPCMQASSSHPYGWICSTTQTPNANPISTNSYSAIILGLTQM